MTPRTQMFGLEFDAVSFAEAVQLLVQAIPGRPAKVVVTPNVDHVISLADNPELKQTYCSADFLFPDGMPVVWSAKLLGKTLPERITGADLFTALCVEAQRHAWHVAVIGGMPGQEAMLLERFAQVYPGLNVSLHCPRMGFDYRGADGQTCVKWVNEIAPDLVFVCLGFPRQDQWSMHVREQVNTGLILGVGASMEFALGLVSRAPLWMQRSGLEWLWRLASNPRKLWRRYLVKGPRFAGIVWNEWRNRHGDRL
jgi:N-acetylglucosaminyldiphosphoundecaprenol N-acetyl-beta-D-mannosaminyltransferase